MPRGCPGSATGGLARRRRLTRAQMAEFTAWVEAGPDPARDGVVRWRRKDLSSGSRPPSRWSFTSARSANLAAGGYRRLSVRPHHPKADPDAQEAFKKTSPEAVTATLPEHARGKPLEIWFQDEARVGQQGTLTRVWAKRGLRPRAPRDTRYDWAYLFGAVCPERGAAAGLVLPFADTAAMNAHLAEIAATVAPGAHALLVFDGAGWHRGGGLVVPPNITLLKLPPAAPELNPVENVWQYLRSNWLAISVFDDYDAIVEASCAAWNRFAQDPVTVASITSRSWATVRE